ncbi:TonB-dependent receptor [Verrucomicrobiaceae bacterium N1E253]|uniref:TonB-dependent receptor n=1 Tax=Oceaniferula marina TaxID=2748318 RepID=A0A851GB67_9BACT|nr:TonB-dependent receptor [Oceaniferula marina]NWK54853.1 TonB-dependent receptor [Oceaniferula marina]
MHQHDSTRYRKLAAPLIPLLLSQCLTTASHAETEAANTPSLKPDSELPESVITALRYQEDLTNTPYSVESLDAEAITAPQYRTLPDALGSLPGVMNQKTAYGHGSPYIRGFTSFRNLMLIDGIRFNNSVFRDGPNQYWNTIDSYGLEGVELVRGPGSTLYGSDAIGGTVNALTRGTRYLEFDQGESFWGATLDYRYDTAGDSHVLRLEGLVGQGEQWGLRVGYTLKDFNDVRSAGVGTMEKTGYDEWAADLRFDYAFNDCTSMTIVHQQVDQDDVWRSHKTIYGFEWEGTDFGSELERSFDQDRSLSYIRFEGKDTGHWVDAWQLTASLQTLDEERYRNRSNKGKGMDRQGFDVDTYGLALQMESDTRVGRLIYGFDYYQDQVDSFNKKYDDDGNFTGSAVQGPVGDDANYDTFGAYVQDVWEINEQWTLNLGARYSYVAADIGKVDTEDGVISIDENWDTLVFSGRALYQANDCWTLFGGISQGYRAPNLSDLSRLDSARSNEIETPAPGLDPEYFTTFEIGGRYGTETAGINASVFYTDIRDMIVRTPTGQVIDGDNEVTKQNAGDGYVWGFELSADWTFAPQWTLFGQAAWIDGEVDTYPTSDPVKVSEPLDRTMPLTGNVGVRWMHPDGRIWVEGVVNAAAKADELSTRDESDTNRIPPGGTPSYVVPSLRGGWQATDNLLLTLALENLTDEEYRIHGSGVNEPGFHAVAGVTLTW